tara:strand:- start:535 stop:888 length:354 start_codon:yes stop_codon:yes gene_type:complete
MKTLIAAAIIIAGGWTADLKDSVCGISYPANVTNPATIQWAVVMKETPEMKLIVKEHIKKDSPRGRVLLQQARSRVQRWTRLVMDEHKYDSVWKKIEHPKKKAHDVSRYVIAKMLAK